MPDEDLPSICGTEPARCLEAETQHHVREIECVYPWGLRRR